MPKINLDGHGIFPAPVSSTSNITIEDNAIFRGEVNISGTCRMPGGIGTGYFLHMRDEKDSGTVPGSCDAETWNDRTINTELRNEITGATVYTTASNFKLPAGTYQIEGKSSCWNADRNRLRLWNDSAAALEIIGTNAYAFSSDSQQVSHLTGRFHLTGTNIFTIDHYTRDAVTDFAWGSTIDDGFNEVYLDIQIWKVD